MEIEIVTSEINIKLQQVIEIYPLERIIHNFSFARIFSPSNRDAHDIAPLADGQWLRFKFLCHDESVPQGIQN
jgi:hypothetical protein